MVPPSVTHRKRATRGASGNVKVLILAYDFPPYVSVGGLRPYGWFRYLADYGVEPVVVTRQWANTHGDERDYVAPSATTRVEVERTDAGTLIRTPYRPNLANRVLLAHGPHRYRRLRRLVTAWYELMQYHRLVGPKVEIYHAARRYLAEHHADVIVATGEPFVLFRYATELSREFGVPWVADYRDPWSQDRTRQALVPGRNEARLERRVVASAAAITTPAEVFRTLLGRLHPGKQIEVVANGYDPEAMAAAAGVAQETHRLAFALVGTIYPWHPLESVLGVFQDFLGTRSDGALALRMVGVGRRESVERLVRTRFPRLASVVSFTPRMANADMARALARANVFLMFNDYANPGTKIYDYLALRRQILLCYSDDPEALGLKDRYYALQTPSGANERVVETILHETGAGTVVRDADHLRQVLGTLETEFRRTRSVYCASQGTERYSRAAQAERLAELLKALASGSSSGACQ